MKVTVVHLRIGKQFGGAELYCYQMIQALRAQKIDLNAISMYLSKASAAKSNFTHIGILPNGKRLRGLYPRLYNRMGLGKLQFNRALYKYAQYSDLIIVGHIDLLPQVTNFAQKNNKKIWLLVYGIDIWRDWSTQEESAIEKCDKIISISNFTAESVKNRIKKGDKKVVIIPCITEPDIFIPNQEEIPSVPRVILTVSRLASNEAYKGHDLIIESLSNVEKRLGIPVEYHIVGEGDDETRLRRLAQRCGVAERVHFRGRLEKDEFLKEYQQCHVFAMPSYVSKRPDGSWTGEGFGIVYIEAAACGKPVLACDVGGQVDCIRHGETGILVKPTVESVEAGLVEILSDLDKARQMGMAGREFVLKNFTREHFNRKWAELLREQT